MRAFEDGQRVRYVGIEGLGSEWKGREGVVTDSFREFDGNRSMVRFDGEERSISFDDDDLEAVKTTYEIENSAEDSSWVSMELTDPEAALIQRVIDGLNNGKPEYAPTLTMKKEEEK